MKKEAWKFKVKGKADVDYLLRLDRMTRNSFMNFGLL